MGITNGYCPNSFRPPPPQTGKRGKKKVPQTILASPYTPRLTWEKSAPNHPSKPSTPPPLLGNAHMETTHFKKGLPFPKNIATWGRVKACNDGLEHFVCINLPGGVRACQDGLEHFFFHVCPFDRGGAGGLERFGQWRYRPNTFQKGAVLSQAMG